MRRFTGSIRAGALIITLSLALWSFESLGQETAASPTPGPTVTVFATPTPYGVLQSPGILRTEIADIYAPSAREEIGPRNYPRGINPLTGLPYPSEEARLRRNLIVKVSNWPPRVRPQHALNQADLVYELESEGGVTRFAAIYRSNSPEKVGSVRSARLVDAELRTMYAAILAYSGTSGPVREIYKNTINRLVLLSPSIGDNCELAGFCRDESVRDRGYEHTLFGDTRQMWQAATWREVNIGYRAVGFAFDLRADAGGFSANDIYINWYNRTDARWQYDYQSQRYLRYADGVPHLDAADGMHLWADNLVMLQVFHNRRPDLFTAGALNESYEVALWGQGPAYVFREGKLYQGYWRRTSLNRGVALSLIYGDEEPIRLKPGRTWVTVMRNLNEVIISSQQANMRATATAIARSES